VHKRFWFYFNFIPFVFGVFILFTPILNLFPLNPPKITNAVEYCSDVINDDIYATEYGTYQDFCIAKFMGESKIFESLIVLLAILGIFFIVPLVVYLIKNRLIN